MSVKIGNMAPAFKLLNQNEQRIELKDFRDKKCVVLYFYPKAMTPGCTVQACGVRDFKKEFARAATVVFGISPDEPVRLEKFRQKEGLNFDLLSDADHKVAQNYGVWKLKKFMGREYMGVSRETFIIDKNGKLAHHLPKVNTKTHHQDVLDWIGANLVRS